MKKNKQTAKKHENYPVGKELKSLIVHVLNNNSFEHPKHIFKLMSKK